MSVPAARSDARLKRYPLRRLRLSTAAGTLDVVAPDSGAWLHTGGWSQKAQLGDEPPYWADVWPAAVALARWLCRRRALAGQRVLDLGCGIGVPGIAAAKLGAQVTFADRQADALAFAEWNARRQLGDGGAVHTVVHDWHAGVVQGAFDLICLADVSYRPVHHRPVLRQLEASLADGGIAVHSDPYRRESEGFLVLAKAAFAAREVAVTTHHDDRRLPVRLWFLARSDADLERWLGAAAPASDAAPSQDATPTDGARGGDGSPQGSATAGTRA